MSLDERLLRVYRGELQGQPLGGGPASARPSLASLVALAFRAEKTAGRLSTKPIYTFKAGSRSFESGLPADTNTLYRIASISKISVALAAAILEDRGFLDLDADLSESLPFTLRNPLFPEEAITATQLLSHRSSLGDADGYIVPLGLPLSSLFVMDEGAASRADGEGRPRRWYDFRPGTQFRYCNLGYGLLATAMETVTGTRFDRLMKDLVLNPAGLEGSFNVDDLSDEQFSRLGTIYRRFDEGGWPSEAYPSASPGVWSPQCDYYGESRPALPCRAAEGMTRSDLDAYVPGTNGTLFSPQGGLRASVRDLSRLATVFLSGGLRDASVSSPIAQPQSEAFEDERLGRVCSEEVIGRLMTIQWTASKEEAESFPPDEATRSVGLGLMMRVGTRDGKDGLRGDSLCPGADPALPPLWGHHGNAYGLLGSLLFDPAGGYGFCYLIGGVSREPENFLGSYSSYSAWEEEIQRALVEELFQ